MGFEFRLALRSSRVEADLPCLELLLPASTADASTQSPHSSAHMRKVKKG